MAINFPAGPSIGDTYTVGGITYTWDGSTWSASGSGGGGGGGISTETDPVFSASAAAGITSANISNWNSAYNNYITRSSLSATNATASGGGSLSYSNINGVFTFTPPDLTQFITSENDTLATVTSRGATTTANVTVNDMLVNGNLTVQGTTTQLGTYTVSSDEIVILDGTTGAPSSDASIRIDRGTSNDVSLRWNESIDTWQFTNNGGNFYNINSYTLGGSNATSNQAILSITGTDASTSSVEFGGSGGTTVTWDGPSSKVTINSTAPVNADWDATSGLAQILNKPTIPTEYTLPIASASILGGIKVGANLTINPSTGVLDANPGSYTLPTASASVLGGIKIGSGLTIDGNGVVDVNVGGGNTLTSRQELSGTTTSIVNNATADLNIDGYKAYSLFAIETSEASWVRVYTTAESRTADATRSEGNDPAPGSGVIAEVRTFEVGEKVQITPGVIGFNYNAIPTTTIYLSVTNRSGASSALPITVTLTAIKLEV
ncbi:tail fiber-like protein [Synechococcus phage S-H9-1]|uniref:Tail fiber-like protein n=1 Tax=Synechococcus phage S-H9-1 TaxID=2783674 RepID=A0A873WKI0_9CAUD|nr:tail fiber-like protein [Synechococcus phage S-H9-1]QPB08161.1 tail fiber-like protein [Synechococcus phage S-H9-1]